ncbi:hypothetical protein [Bacillus sp. EB01]|uniref:hypothetical protein n=1 Tax=Bacillus sp. EB01 TaxID=1347086 RepID=UPI0005C5B348|nr:hypothetical protein [Bacillus sp. EB01]
MKFKTRCYLVYGIAPAGINAKEVNYALNQWIKNKAFGKIIYHEHFANKPLGGIAVFEVNSKDELEFLKKEPSDQNSFLFGWNLSYHPMTHSTNTNRFVYQIQYTMSSYGGTSMTYEIKD